ncbi:MAG TPA: EF-hand domain-containing protein [Gammaproteobacteria bacterium]|nr:EF-hand domain-containing protein [Gammaproteobacteria bacterium]
MQKQIFSLATLGLFFSAAALAGGLSFTELDTDGDGAISKAEAAGSATLAPLFADADSNGDGKLDKDEFAALVQPTEGSAPAKQ